LTELECNLLRSLKGHHKEFVFTYKARGKKGGKGGTGQAASYEKDKRYPITVEALTTRWQRDRAKAAIQVPSVATLAWHDLRHNSVNQIIPATDDQPRYFLENREVVGAC
jgi:hypothetical protein